ncbi:hypothetical protein SAMN05443144_105146 [Fodinibius roseus]|uniref:Acetyltransferase (GNAT) domain-containing protein n=1 Tax=Fodinibius roseus TaxID=1194090 RepID=A0A1M4YST7_9BACT|nr:hypothetical protein SAMN05443144_105146 [Fodinibius roseus]
MQKATNIKYSKTKEISPDQIIPLYKQNDWSSAKKPNKLHKALINSHSLVSAWSKNQLIGIGNAISDGYLVSFITRTSLYFPHFRTGELARISLSYSQKNMKTTINIC